MTAIATPPFTYHDEAEHRRLLAGAIIRLIGSIATGRLIFSNGTTSSTLVISGLVPSTGHVSLSPMNATAQAASWSVAYTDNTATFTHGNPGADAEFSFFAVLS
jgi:hypothetical protein